MQVLVVPFGPLFLFRLLGALGVGVFATWIDSARVALATLFFVASILHFAPTKNDLLAMVPPVLPRPDLLVAFTAVAELAGAAGLLFPETTFWAACGLMLLLILILPANVSAAQRGVLLRGRATTALRLRVPTQLLLITWAWIVR